MTLLRRTFSTALVASALSVTALAAPAQADPASGGNYASSIATRTFPYFNNLPGRSIQLRAQILSTSSASGNLHGKVVITIRRSATGSLVGARTLTVSGPSGKVYTAVGTFPTTVPRGAYTVSATFTPTSGHIEKGSSGASTNTFYPG